MRKKRKRASKAKQRYFGPQDPGKHKHQHPIPPDPLTEACSLFFAPYVQLLGFFTTFAKFATETIASSVPQSTKKRSSRKSLAIMRWQRNSTALLSYIDLLNEMWLIKTVESYLSYIAGLLTLVFKSKPETLRSAELVSYEFVLQYQSMEELVSALAEKKVEKLSYAGMRELSDFYETKLSLRLFEKKTHLKEAVLYVEMRNLFVHNHGIVNRIFLSRTQDSSFEIGQRVKPSIDTVLSAAHHFGYSVARVDQTATKKFQIQNLLSRAAAGL